MNESTTRGRILVVDDEPTNGHLLEEILEEGGYHQRRTLTDSRDVVRAFGEFEPDLILLDLMMPHLDGFGVLEQLRPLLAPTGYLPILVLTADANPAVKRRALASGAKDFLTKPFDPLEVLLRIRNLLETRVLYRLQQQRADERIQEQAALIDRATDAILVCDTTERITFWNQSAEAIYGWTAAEAVGQGMDQVLSQSQSAPDFADARDLFRGAGKWSGELRQRTRGGAEIVVASRWTLVLDHDGQAKCILVINTDITERKKLEAQYLRAQRMESIGLLAGGIAHDLNNILTPMTMGVDLLRARCSDARSLSLLGIMQTSAQRGADLVRQVLTFARGARSQRQPLRLDPLVSELVKLLEQTFPKAITIQAAVQKNLLPVLADSTQLHQVLANLCLNARDAMPRGGRLTLTARNQLLTEKDARVNPEVCPGPYVVLEVEDTGSGIPTETISKIFDPFFTTREIGKGTGLGLSTALGIVKSHNGSLKVYSEVGKGTRFLIYLPALELAPRERASEVRHEVPGGNGELILVVDDEAALQQFAQVALVSAGYRVLTAQNGAEGVALYARQGQEIDVVLTDMMMPVMDGPAMIEVLRQLNPHVKIVALSGLNIVGHGIPILGACVRAFLPKPYTIEALLTTLRSVLEGKTYRPLSVRSETGAGLTHHSPPLPAL